jgi:hypothetical protein
MPTENTHPRPPRGRRQLGPLPGADVEYLILADAVEAMNGKLYMMGGGWSTIFVRELTRPVQVSFACGVVVPWNVADDDHTLEIRVQTQDGIEIAPPFTVGFRTGRPANLERGAASHLPFAVKAEYTFPDFGAYSLRASVDPTGGNADVRQRHFQFFVRPAQPPQVMPPQ